MNITKRILLFCCLATAVAVNAQELIPQSNGKGKWGFTDENGTTVIKFNYDEARPFDNGLAKVRKGDNWGLIDPMGKEVLPIKYNLIETFAPSVYRIAAGGKIKDGVLLNEKYGFASTTGEILLKPEYDEVGQFTDGCAYIKKGGLYGYINDKIDIIIPCQYKAVGTFNNDGYVWVCTGGNADKDNPNKIIGGKVGIYDKNGTVLVPAKYTSAGIFLPFVRKNDTKRQNKMSLVQRTVLTESNSHTLYAKYTISPSKFTTLKDGAVGFWMSNKSDGSKNGIVDLNGTVIILENKYNHAWYPTDGMMMVQIKSGYGQYNFVNTADGSMLLNENAQDCWAFKNGYAVIRRPDVPIKKANANSTHHYSIINLKGERVSNLYDEIFPANDGVHIVQNDSKYGLIASDGRTILEANNNVLYPPSEKMLLRQIDSNDRFGYVDINGKWVIQPQYTNGYSFKHGWAAVKGDKGWGYIDTKSEIKVPLEWYSVAFISSPDPKIIFVYPDKDGGAMPMNVATGRLLGENRYTFNRNFGLDYDDAAIVGKDKDNVGIIDTEGNVIIPPLFPIATTRAVYKKFLESHKAKWTETDTYRTNLINDTRCNKGRLNQKLESNVWDY